MSIEAEKTSLEEVSNADLEKQIESSSSIILSEDGDNSPNDEPSDIDDEDASVVDDEDASVVDDEDASVVDDEDASVVDDEDASVVDDEDASIVNNDDADADDDDDDDDEDAVDGTNMPCHGFTTIIKRRNDEPETHCDYYIEPPTELVQEHPDIMQGVTNSKQLRSKPDVQKFVAKLKEMGPAIYEEFLDEKCIEKLNGIKFKSRINDLLPIEKEILTNTEFEHKKNVISDLLLDDEDDETDSDTDNEEFFQKLESDVNTDHLIIYHPELMQNNYQEIKAFCKVLRNKQGIIVDPLHTTLPFLTKYEKARVLGVRCKQINNNADTFVKVPPNVISGMLIAEEELKQKKIPFIIRRPLPNGGSEYWRIEDLEIIEY